MTETRMPMTSATTDEAMMIRATTMGTTTMGTTMTRLSVRGARKASG